MQINTGNTLASKIADAKSAENEVAETPTPAAPSLADENKEAEKALNSINLNTVQEKQITTTSTEPVQNALDKEIAENVDKAPKASQPSMVTFMSRYPKYTVHISSVHPEVDKQGQKRRTSIPVVFRNGIFSTNDPAIIEGMREALLKSQGNFQEAKDMSRVARMSESMKKQREILSSANSGVTTSADGDLQNMATSDAHLQQMQNEVYRQAANAAAADGG